MEIRDDIALQLARRGARLTPQRMKLAQIVFAKPQHVSAEQVLKIAHAEGVRVSKATVYNTLHLFADCGLVRELVVDRDRVYYDSTVGPHHHFFNMDTGEMIDIPEDQVALAGLPAMPEGTEAEGVEVIIRVRNRV